ncbi:site-specific integrase [Shewanella aquimarina]|uniref:site-specific integrase n=1 Tax=Shewanella aquimarina TaxID=260365 RepID=UPI0020149375|nr:site-specific integrase [Shewanella aquimarina]MCL2908549.1 site-specific integrase [Shewanella aquimarina]
MINSLSKNPPYLFQSRHGIWYARIVVPEAQQGILGKREIRKSLATRDRLEAVRKSWRVLSQLQSVAEAGSLESKESTHTLTPTKDSAPVTTSAVSTRKAKLPRLTQVVEEFCQEKLKQGSWSPHSEQVNRMTFKDMVSLLGDIRLDQFTLAKALEYKRYFSSKADLSVSTVNKRLTRVSALLHWAGLHYGTGNPMAGLSIKVSTKVKTSKARDALSEAKIKQLFRELPPTSELKFPYRAWLPRLAAYTGARLGELAQLYLDDFIVIDGYPCILIRATHSDQSIKTATSERVIPIHPKLIAMGFLQYAEKQRLSGQERLFPELRRQAIRGYSHQVSKWFCTFKAKLGWTKRDTLHGIRHAVATQLKHKEYSSDLVAGLLGHAHGSITFDRYGKEYKVENMLKLVKALDWGDA